jgi:hypothetical protein
LVTAGCLTGLPRTAIVSADRLMAGPRAGAMLRFTSAERVYRPRWHCRLHLYHRWRTYRSGTGKDSGNPTTASVMTGTTGTQRPAVPRDPDNSRGHQQHHRGRGRRRLVPHGSGTKASAHVGRDAVTAGRDEPRPSAGAARQCADCVHAAVPRARTTARGSTAGCRRTTPAGRCPPPHRWPRRAIRRDRSAGSGTR